VDEVIAGASTGKLQRHGRIFLPRSTDSRQDYVTPGALFKPANLNSCAMPLNT
jgi:hypothetical protein